MQTDLTDRNISGRIVELGRQVLALNPISRQDALWLFDLESSSAIFDLLAQSNRIREHFHGDQIHLCSIVNAKAGGCPEDCKFCAQSAFYQTGSPRSGFIDPEPVQEAAQEAARNTVAALGLVAAWKGLNEGPMLNEVCDRIRELAANGSVRADAGLGLIKSRLVAKRLKEAGLQCYNHNLETSRRFFPNICTTHSYEDRLETLRLVSEAGIPLCCGGLFGMGETREDRCDLALTLREIDPAMVPLNFLNPIPGTPFAGLTPLSPLEILKTIACFRFILPRQEILIAGGRAVNLRDLQSMVFPAGASGLMVGNYLTTINRSVEQDLQLLRDLGLRPRQTGHKELTRNVLNSKGEAA